MTSRVKEVTKRVIEKILSLRVHRGNVQTKTLARELKNLSRPLWESGRNPKETKNAKRRNLLPG